MEFTEEEFTAFDLVRKIVSSVVCPERITRREMKCYMSITLDDSPRMTICRIYAGKKRFIGIVDNRKVETKIHLEAIDDIYKYGQELKHIAAHHCSRNDPLRWL